MDNCHSKRCHPTSMGNGTRAPGPQGRDGLDAFQNVCPAPGVEGQGHRQRPGEGTRGIPRICSCAPTELRGVPRQAETQPQTFGRTCHAHSGGGTLSEVPAVQLDYAERLPLLRDTPWPGHRVSQTLALRVHQRLPRPLAQCQGSPTLRLLPAQAANRCFCWTKKLSPNARRNWRR